MTAELCVETVVVSDLHLSEAQSVDPRRPLWMAYKRREFFVDDDFIRFLEHIEQQADGPVELVLNGDTFDFDNVIQLPSEPDRDVDWLARLRGLSSEEWMSLFKMDCIAADHEAWFEALGAFIRRGNRVVLIVGNHDVELSWPSVQDRIRQALGLAPRTAPDSLFPPALALADGAQAPPSSRGEHPDREPLTFCNWFYLSGGDTFISHGHQLDPHCVQRDPIDPLIRVHGRPQVRIPFGDLAGRYLLNGMGYFNPHATENYIMGATQYAKFFFRHMVRTQPLLVWSWFWGALVTFFIALRSSWRPPMRDPLLVEAKVRAIARRAQTKPSTVRKLDALCVPPSSNNPFLLVRELWLDRALLLLATVYAAWQIVLHINVAFAISPLWVLVPLALLLPPYFMYAAAVRPTVFTSALLTDEHARLIAAITGARQVVLGHTHRPTERAIGKVRYFNDGFWSQAFAEPQCQNRIGTQTFVWIRPGDGPKGRKASLCEWPPGGHEPRLYQPRERPRRGRRRRR